MAAFIGFLTGSLWCFVALANEGHADWHDVELGSGAIAGALGGSLGWTIPVVLMAEADRADAAPLRQPRDPVRP